MLFDLRGRGRRRTVQVIYLGLALIFLIGFVGFGVGVGGGGGGLLNALTGNNGANSASFAGQISKAQKSTRLRPNDPSAWAALTEAQLHQAGASEYYSGEQYNSKGKELLTQAARSWSTYLALESHNPSPELAHKMLNVFGAEALNQPAQAVQALQIVIGSEPPTLALYEKLAFYAYKAHNTREGDLAAARSVGLAPAADRKHLKTELEELKRNPNATPTGGSSVPSGTYTTTVGGKTTVLKSSGNGTLTGTAATSATPPAGHTTSTKK
jgi:hypothetical protein